MRLGTMPLKSRALKTVVCSMKLIKMDKIVNNNLRIKTLFPGVFELHYYQNFIHILKLNYRRNFSGFCKVIGILFYS